MRAAGWSYTPLVLSGPFVLLAVLIVLATANRGRADDAAPRAAKADDNGFLVHAVRSPWQEGPTRVRVLLPDRLVEGKRYPVVYVLPVEAGDENRYGDGLLEIKRHALHNKHEVIFAAPTFSRLPWYADHPTNAAIGQESYLLKSVVPLMDANYPTRAEAQGRLLLGFSKSGWGAWSLLLRHADTFGRAAAWDAPLVDPWAKYGSEEIFGTRENYAARHIPRALEQRAAAGQIPRGLILLGYSAFRHDQQQVHSLLEALKIPHVYRDGPHRKHDWHAGWVSEAVALLVAD